MTPTSSPVEPPLDLRVGMDFGTQSAEVTTALISAQVISEYLRWAKSRKLAHTTVKTARTTLHGFARRVQVHILEAGRDEMESWQATRSEELNPGSLLTQITYIRLFFRWALDHQLITEDPSVWLVPPGAPHRLPRPIDDADFQRALRDAPDDDIRAILGCGRYAGMRACEVAALDWSEVNLRSREPRLRVLGKGRRERIIDICPELADLLAVLPHRSGPVIRRRDGRAGRNSANRISQMANRYLRECGIEDTFHATRHQFVTRVNDVGGLRAAQEAAGHANPATTAGYAAVGRRALRDAIVAAAELDIEEVDRPRRPLPGGDVHPNSGATGTRTVPTSAKG